VGDSLYQTYCAVCHGPTGAGDGKVGVQMGALPLISDRARAFSDGYLYSIIRYGGAIMPRYGDRVRGVNRWEIVNYVRQLQRPAAAPAPSAEGTSR
jgi:high-affinity iron transporter